jgi:acyl carrier protein
MSSNPIVQDDLTQVEEVDVADTAHQLKAILADVLGIDAEDADALEADSGLFGHLPELDSMAVAGLLTEIEDRLAIVIEDDDVDGEMLETFGGLLAFVEAKLSDA